jgi:two-component system, chemotaxis family, sensor kinase CheA
MDDLLGEFITETSEAIESLDVELVKLEQNPNDPELLGNIFRLVHTIKGTCGFLGLPRLEAVAHAGENVLGNFRNGTLEVTPEAVSLILQALDRIKMIMAALEQTESEPEGDDGELIAELNVLAAATRADEGDAPEAVMPEFPDVAAVAVADAEAPAAETPDAETPAAETPPDEPAAEIPSPAEPAAAPAVPAKAPAAPAKAPAAAKTAGKGESSIAQQTIRVNVDLLENLMTMVSELVLTRNQLMQMVRKYEDSEFKVPLQRLSHVTTDLQEGVMKTRMQPIGNAWGKLPRIVRDLSHELDKKIELKMVGADTELDRQVLEMIKDPLTHMVRNSGDHGLETPAERLAAGKSETGTITLNAYHEGGHILIEIGDNGRGIDVEKVKAKAVANGLASEADLETMADQQVLQFIFKAGFSTAEKVTSVSGRGVGMDVVRTNIEKIGGHVELKSRTGEGSTFTIKIPLTLAIVSSLIVACGGERFAIPQIAVLELVRVSSESEHRVERIKDTQVLRLRNRLLPLVSLGALLKLDGGNAEEADAGAEDETFIIVTQVGAYSFGIIVDKVFDTEEIVVKPVAPILRDIAIYSGNTILGDGSVIMILDPNGIAAATGEVRLADPVEDRAAAAQESAAAERVALLVFRSGGPQPKAVPLALVARLEEIERATIEYSDGTPMVQYRGALMPLLSLQPDFKPPGDGRQPVLVFTDRDRSMGLMVDEIVDIVEERLNVELPGNTPGALGSAVLAGKATEIFDASAFLTRAYGDWFDVQRGGGKDGSRRVLLVDDSPFFRNLLTPLLTVAGYEVTSVESADKALSLGDAGAEFDVIISDIEMPGMDGFTFAQEVRSRGLWRAAPLVALSSHAQPSDLERGREAGFADYIPKLDREALLETLSQSVAHPAPQPVAIGGGGA